MDKVNITIIGAGVIGLAIAAEVSKQYDDIIVLEKNSSFGTETSSRNSEVIHSGIYYPTDSLKARLCVEGAELIYDFCIRYLIPHSRVGKLIVATNEDEISQIIELYYNGLRNGVKNLSIIEKKDIYKNEPNVNAVLAIYSQNTGIVDSHAFMKSLFKIAKVSKVLFSFNSEVNLIDITKEGFLIHIKNDDYKFISRVVINSAGLYSDCIAQMVGIDIDRFGYKLNFCKGSYFSYAKPSPVKRLIYPVPNKELIGLGVHATLDLGGRLRFGPDVEYIDSIDYKVNVNKLDDFYNGASKIIKGLDKNAFIPDMAGIRPKLQSHNEKIRDFVVSDESDKNLPRFINLIGIESPGLTASLAIAKMVSSLVAKALN